MRLETKLAAIVAGIVVIGVGIWYMGSEPADQAGDPADLTTADAADTPQADQPQSETPADQDAGVEDAEVQSVGLGSPLSLTVRQEQTPSNRPGLGGLRSPLRRTGLADHAGDREDRPIAWTSDTDNAPDTPDLPTWSSLESDTADTSDATTTVMMPETETTPAVEEPRASDDEPAESPWTATDARPVAPEPVAAALKPMKTHVIKLGDTFTSLAVRYFGHAKYAGLIMEANPDLDPRRLRLGVNVKIPPAPDATPTTPAPAAPDKQASVKVTAPVAPPAIKPPPADRAYTVQPGDRWYTLAQRFLGNGNDWPELYELNRERVSHNPHLLRAGTVIELPASAKAGASTSITDE